MKIEFNPTSGLIVIPARLYGVDVDTIARMALDTGRCHWFNDQLGYRGTFGL